MPPKAATPKKTTKAAAKPAVKRAPAKKKTTTHATTPVVHRPAVKHVKRTYIFAVGRRKSAIARVRWHQTGEHSIEVNKTAFEKYFPSAEYQGLIRSPLVLTHEENHGYFTVRVAGGGTQGQAEAVRLGIARVLVKNDPDLRVTLKRAGFLRRDPRVKERKKYGLKRARRAPQWQKR